MRRNKRDFGRLILIAIFLFVAVLLPNLINAISRAAGTLGTFAAGETGIKLCATISGGDEDALRFNVTNNQGFQADVVVPADTCKNIHTEAATYHVRQYVSQEYAIDSVSGGTISADDTDFVATASGQYSIVYANSYSQKPYLHNFGNTSTATASSAVEVTFDANGGTGTMAPQYFGLNAQRTLTANAFTRVNSNFNGWNTEADGSGTSYTDEQALTFSTGGELKLYAQWFEIDFTRAAVASSDIYTANGNGLSTYLEKGEIIHYYRGEVDNNNVIWANKCWKIIRTTYTGGTKIIYNGEPTIVGGAQQCNATGTDTQIEYNGNNTFAFNNIFSSPADSGYMYGTRLKNIRLTVDPTVNYIFSNNVNYTKSTDTYVLNTGSGQSISGTWPDQRSNALARYHYFCTDGSSSCDSTMIGYIGYYSDDTVISYLEIGGYVNIEAAKTAMFTNTTDSIAKNIIESWFEDENLDGHLNAGDYNYEDDLEDAIFCNDRSYYSGALQGEEIDVTIAEGGFSHNMAHKRNAVIGADGNLKPSLDCDNKNDAFTKVETSTTNGKLKHKVGLITEDEATLAGIGYRGYKDTAYLYTGENMWTMSPNYFSSWSYNYALENLNTHGAYVSMTFALRPVVSLKSSIKFAESGTGTTTNPYIVE